jgi:hypothetical protein
MRPPKPSKPTETIEIISPRATSETPKPPPLRRGGSVSVLTFLSWLSPSAAPAAAQKEEQRKKLSPPSIRRRPRPGRPRAAPPPAEPALPAIEICQKNAELPKSDKTAPRCSIVRDEIWRLSRSRFGTGRDLSPIGERTSRPPLPCRWRRGTATENCVDGISNDGKSDGISLAAHQPHE